MLKILPLYVIGRSSRKCQISSEYIESFTVDRLKKNYRRGLTPHTYMKNLQICKVVFLNWSPSPSWWQGGTGLRSPGFILWPIPLRVRQSFLKGRRLRMASDHIPALIAEQEPAGCERPYRHLRGAAQSPQPWSGRRLARIQWLASNLVGQIRIFVKGKLSS